MTDHSITVTRRYSTARRRVFEAWTRPRLLRRWAFGPDPVGTKSVRLDLFPGGRLELLERGGLDRKHYWGRFHEVHPPDRLRFSWVSNEPRLRGAKTRVTVHIEGSQDESTLTLTQEGFPDEEARDVSRAAWEDLLDLLGQALTED